MAKLPPTPSENIGEARPVDVAVSVAELVALSRYHLSECNKVKNRLGKLVTANPFAFRDTKAAVKAANELITHHTTRAKGLLAIAREHIAK